MADLRITAVEEAAEPAGRCSGNYVAEGERKGSGVARRSSFFCWTSFVSAQSSVVSCPDCHPEWSEEPEVPTALSFTLLSSLAPLGMTTTVLHAWRKGRCSQRFETAGPSLRSGSQSGGNW
jgi:hypothetical protein